jgi:hypothetical protein
VKAGNAGAYQAGGAVLGNFWRGIGRTTEAVGDEVMAIARRTNPSLRVFRGVGDRGVPVGGRLIDRALVAARTGYLEMKYGLPTKSGRSFNRLVGQIQAMVESGQEVHVWTLKEILKNDRDLRRLEKVLGPGVFQRVRFHSGVRELYELAAKWH